MAKKQRQRRRLKDVIDRTTPAHHIINEQFEGLMHFCRLTGYTRGAAWSWLKSGYIPAVPARRGAFASGDHNVHQHIIDVAAANKIRIKPADFVQSPQAPLVPSGDGEPLQANG